MIGFQCKYTNLRAPLLILASLVLTACGQAYLKPAPGGDKEQPAAVSAPEPVPEALLRIYCNLQP